MEDWLKSPCLISSKPNHRLDQCAVCIRLQQQQRRTDITRSLIGVFIFLHIY